MKTTQYRSWKTRTAALGLGLAVAGGFFVTAAPAQAAPTHWVSGMVLGQDEDGLFAPLEDADVAPFPGADPTPTDAEGYFTLPFESGSYEITVAATGYVTQTIPVEVGDDDVTLDNIELMAEEVPTPTEPTPELPAVPAGTVAISGDLVVGSVLTATVAGWPADASLTYEWGYSGGQYGGGIDGATSSTYTVTNAELGMFMVALVTAKAEGFTPTTASAFTGAVVTAAPVKPAVAAPVSNSTALAAYLAGKGVSTHEQASAGLPAGALNPTSSYSAKLAWTNTTDSFVDVYLYSTPTFVGSFAVVDGVARISLSATVLSQLAAGDHTLVAMGQTSGTVQSVAVKIAATLAETGSYTAVPFGAAALLLLLGGALLVLRRRSAHA